MLVLSRKIQEAIIINDDITITVLSVNGNQVRLGFDAPLSVRINREEIYHKIKKEQKGNNTYTCSFCHQEYCNIGHDCG